MPGFLNKYFHQSFKKIRSCKNKKKLNELEELLLKRTNLVQKMKTAEERDIEEIEN